MIGFLINVVLRYFIYAYTSCSFSTAALSMMNLSALRMSYTLRVDAIVVRTPGMFAADLTTLVQNFRSNYQALAGCLTRVQETNEGLGLDLALS